MALLMLTDKNDALYLDSRVESDEIDDWDAAYSLACEDARVSYLTTPRGFDTLQETIITDDSAPRTVS